MVKERDEMEAAACTDTATDTRAWLLILPVAGPRERAPTERKTERKYTDIEEERSCRSWLLLVPPGTRAEMDSGSKEREVRRCRARGRRPASSRWTRRRLGKRERERERSKEESAWRALSDREAEEKMSDLFSLSLFPAFYPRSSSFGPLHLPSFRLSRGKERERLKGEKGGDGIKRRKKRERERERDTGEKWTASERRQPRATSRAATLLSEGSLSLSLYTPLRRTVSLKRCIKLRVHRESGNYWRCSPRICVECSLAMFSSG